jgi:hypothetical protein
MKLLKLTIKNNKKTTTTTALQYRKIKQFQYTEVIGVQKILPKTAIDEVLCYLPVHEIYVMPLNQHISHLVMVAARVLERNK